ncbi:MAG: glutathionylspermidine synthase family protein [Phycisphaerales bacterium]|nr:glutathionylspermidine synthase family protein [Phycisphaerales bacterium]
MSALALGPEMSRAQAAEMRLRLAFDHGKYDLHLGDHSTIAARPILLSASEWSAIARDSEALWRESVELEARVLANPRLLTRLGLPRALIAEVRRATRHGHAGVGARFVRYDFHPTPDGWRISEANADVPGGFLESAALTPLFLDLAPGCSGAGDPCSALAGALAQATGSGEHVALIHATAYTDDRQSMAAIAERLEALGVPAMLLAPDQLRERDGALFARLDGEPPARIGAVARFFPAEWLPNLHDARAWRPLAAPRARCVLNPVSAIVSQSKRLPLLWDEVGLPLPTWRRLLPETRDPRSCAALADWALKPALGRVGEAVYLPGARPIGERRAPRLARKRPGHWVAQRRFDTLALPADGGPALHPCVGVFVLDGRAVGAYGRLSASPLIDQHAAEAAVLIQPPAEACAA